MKKKQDLLEKKNNNQELEIKQLKNIVFNR